MNKHEIWREVVEAAASIIHATRYQTNKFSSDEIASEAIRAALHRFVDLVAPQVSEDDA